MGPFYSNSAFRETITASYANLPYDICIAYETTNLVVGEQHTEMLLFSLRRLVHGSNFHNCMRAYASGLISKGTL